MSGSPAAAPSPRAYQQVLTRLLRHNAMAQIRKIIEKTQPADLAPVVAILLEDDRRRILLTLVESGRAARVLLSLEQDQIKEIFDELDDSTVVAICNSSAPDDAADLLDILDEERRDQILARLDPSKGAKLEALLVRDWETAGSLMNTEYLALDEEITVSSAIEAIRQYPRKDSFFYVYTVDGEDHLVGVLSLRNLILAPTEQKLSSIMVQNVIRTTLEATQEEVARIVAKYDLLSIPVVDNQNRLVGVVTVDDVIDVIQEEAEEDLLHLAGVAVSERVTTPTMTSFRMRFPWLLINLGTAFVASSVVKLFEGTIERWAALAVFMPIVAGMGGNAATQTLTVFVRGLAVGEVDWQSRWWPLVKELIVGFANGLGNGVVTALIVGFWTGDWIMAAILCLAMIFNLIIAGVAGGLIPLILEKFGFDPAISSSIFVTTFTDVGGFFSFLGLAAVALHYRWHV